MICEKVWKRVDDVAGGMRRVDKEKGAGVCARGHAFLQKTREM